MTLTELQPDWASSGSKRHATTVPERQWKGGKASSSSNRKWQKELSNLKDMFIIKVPLSLCRSTLGLLKVNTRRKRERERVEWERRQIEVWERERERENNKKWQKVWRSCFQFTSVWESCVCMCVFCVCVTVVPVCVWVTCVCVCVCFNWIT